MPSTRPCSGPRWWTTTAWSPLAGQADDRASSTVCIYVADADADVVFAAAVARGAVVREPPATFVTGDRYASVYDPFGHRWAIMTRVEDVSPEEEERRLAEWSAQQS